MTLFRATLADVPRMEVCARMCCAEHGELVLGGKLDWPHYQDWWIGLLESGSGFLLGYEHGGESVAGFGAAKFVDPITNQLRAIQVFLYAQPAFRGQISIRAILRRYEQWAMESGCLSVTMPCLPSMPERTGLFYQRLGYLKQQETFMKVFERNK